MSAVAKVFQTNAAFQASGRVAGTEEDGILRVETAAGVFRARRAFSCLVDPTVDDGVLLRGTPDGGCYVLAVLERLSAEPARLVSDGDLEVKLPRGRFVVAAQEGVELLSARELTVAAGAVRVHADEGYAVFRQLSLLGSWVRAEFERIKVLADSCDTTLERLLQRVKRSYRFVEEHDQVRAAQIDYAAQKNASLRGENALVTAKKLVKVDGEQIHVG
jgi:hypothetical protein